MVGFGYPNHQALYIIGPLKGVLLKEEFHSMKSLNRTLSLVLVLAMCLGLMGVASAAAYTDTATIKNTAAVETLSALGVIGGRTNGSFDPTGIVTRAEMCKMIVVALNGGVAPVLSASATPTYTDIKGTWAQAYIEYATKLGIVAGMGDGTFAPDATVTGSQAAKMMLVALGYDATAEGFTGTGWEIAVGVRASQKSLYSGLSLDPSAGLTRDNAAQVIYNGINAVMVYYDYKLVTGSNGQLTTVAVVKDSTATANTIAADKFGLTAKYAVITHVTYNSTTKVYTYTVAAPVGSYASYLTATASTAFTSTVDYSAYFEQNVKILYTTTSTGISVYGVYPVASNVVSTGVFGALETEYLAAGVAAATYFTASSTTYKFSAAIGTIPLYLNNVATDVTFAAVAAAPTTYAPYTYKFIDKEGDGYIDAVVLYPFQVGKVTYVGSTSIGVTLSVANGSTSSIPLLTSISVYSGIAVNDYVKVTPSTYTATGVATYEKITTLEGAVSAVSSPKVMIGTTWLADSTGLPMALGTTYTKIAQVNGFIYYATATSSVTSASQYALGLDAATASGLNGDQARLMLSDGTFKTVDTVADYSAGGALLAGTPGTPVLVNYTVSASTGKYTLTAAAVGSYDYAVVSPVYAYSSTAGAGYISGTVNSVAATCSIDDAATVFVNVSSGTSFKVMTGAQFKLLGAATINKAYVSVNTSTGFSTVKLAYASTTSTALGSSSYGYVTANVTVLGGTDGTTPVSQISFWNGTETKTLKTSAVDATIVKGMVITYTLNADGTFIPVPAAGLVKSAVTAYDGTNLLFEDVAATSSSVSSTKTTVMYIDSENYAGVAGGAISMASKTSGGAYIDNAYYIDGTTSGYALVVIDTKNAMAAVSAVTVTSAAADTAAELTALYTYATTVTISDAYVPAEAVAVPTGKTLVAASATLASDVTGAGTLSVGTFTNNATSAAHAKTSIVKLTAASTGDVYEAIPGIAGKTLILNVASTAGAVGVLATNVTPAKFYSAAGTLSGTVGVYATPAVSGATTAGIVEAGTYTWNTTTINAGTASANNTTAYAAWLK